MDKITNGIVTVIGVLLLLPLIGINQLGGITDGITAWLVAIAVLAIGIKGLLGK